MRSLAVIDAIETMDQIDRVRNRPTQTVCESSGIEDNECDGADPVYKHSSHRSDGIKSEDCELRERADRRVKEMGNTNVDEETKRDELSSAPMCYHHGGKMFDEDVGQHRRFCPMLLRQHKK